MQQSLTGTHCAELFQVAPATVGVNSLSANTESVGVCVCVCITVLVNLNPTEHHAGQLITTNTNKDNEKKLFIQ